MPKKIETAEGEAPVETLSHAATDQQIDAWVHDWFRDSPISRSTEAWNHLFTAVQDLKRRLSAG